MCTAMDSPPCRSETQDDLLSKIDSRKSNKPLMEKKRRQRINRCLNDLKSLVLEGMKKDPSRYSKLEKADILEMTVRHVQALHRHEGVGCRLGGGGRLLGNGRPMGGDGRTKYRAGFIHCAVEVTRYLAGLSGVPHDLHHRLISHLNTVTASLTCVPGMGQLPSASVAVGGGVVTVAPPPASRPDTSSATTATDASSSIPRTLGLPSAVSCMSPPPVAPTLTTNLTTSTSVAFAPGRLAPQQATQVLPSPSSSAPLTTLVQATQPRALTLPALPTAAKTHSGPDLKLTNSENASVPQTSQLPKNITLVVRGDESNPQETVRGLVSSGIFPPRILPTTSSVLTPSGESIPSSTPAMPVNQDEVSVTATPAVNQDEVSVTATPAVTPAQQGHVAQLSGPIQLSSESHGKVTSSSWAAPLGFQVSFRVSSAASPPVFSAPLWSSPVLVRPTPTLPAAVQHPSSASPILSPSSLSSSSSSSCSSSSSLSSPSSSSSSGTSALPIQAPAQQNASPAPSSSKEPLDLATNHPPESALASPPEGPPRASLVPPCALSPSPPFVPASIPAVASMVTSKPDV